MTSSEGLRVSQVFLSKRIEPGIRLIRNAHSSKQLTNLKFFSPSSFAFNSVRVILFIKVDRKIWLGWQFVSITFCKENKNRRVTQMRQFPITVRVFRKTKPGFQWVRRQKGQSLLPFRLRRRLFAGSQRKVRQGTGFARRIHRIYMEVHNAYVRSPNSESDRARCHIVDLEKGRRSGPVEKRDYKHRRRCHRIPIERPSEQSLRERRVG